MKFVLPISQFEKYLQRLKFEFRRYFVTIESVGGDVTATSVPVKVAQPWGPAGSGRHRRAKDDGVCELEIFCGSGGRGDDRTSSGVVRLPIRGQPFSDSARSLSDDLYV